LQFNPRLDVDKTLTTVNPAMTWEWRVNPSS